MQNPVVTISSKPELVKLCIEKGLMIFAAPASELVAGSYTPGLNKVVLRSSHTAAIGGTVHQELLKVVPDNSGKGSTIEQSNVLVPDTLLESLNEGLQNDQDDIRRISSWPITRAFVCLDVSDFSLNLPVHQALVVNRLNEIVRGPGWELPNLTEEQHLEMRLCTGDGYIYVFREPCAATFFGARLAHLLDKSIADNIGPELHYRIGIHVGEVFSIWDPGRKDWNYIGKGINGATRILQAIGKELDDVVYVSGAIRDKFLGKNVPPLDISSDGLTLSAVIRDCMDNRGRKKDKHKEIWRVYQLNHTRIATTLSGWRDQVRSKEFQGPPSF